MFKENNQEENKQVTLEIIDTIDSFDFAENKTDEIEDNTDLDKHIKAGLASAFTDFDNSTDFLSHVSKSIEKSIKIAIEDYKVISAIRYKKNISRARLNEQLHAIQRMLS